LGAELLGLACLASTAMPGSHTRRVAVTLGLGLGLTTMEEVSRLSM